ncbi:lipoyl synthase [Candidatus Foliamicus sp.]
MKQSGSPALAALDAIPVVSGAKYRTPQGFNAIKNGRKRGAGNPADRPGRKPPWLRARLPSGKRYLELKALMRTHRLATVCEESLCPNIGECWTAGTATLMVMGGVCTRACSFCAVDTGNPSGWLDPEEPANAAETARRMDLRYVVLTSVDRDDLPDGGAAHFARCVRAIRRHSPKTAVEVLTPDFRGSEEAVRAVLASGPVVFAHNIETVRRLSSRVRDPRAGYDQSLRVLGAAARHGAGILTKSSIMLGLGERREEIHQAMHDLRAHGVSLLTLGQYLRPTPHHLPVERFVPPEEFAEWRQAGLAAGFREVVAGPLVRSSYRAERALMGNNAGVELRSATVPAGNIAEPALSHS